MEKFTAMLFVTFCKAVFKIPHNLSIKLLRQRKTLLINYDCADRIAANNLKMIMSIRGGDGEEEAIQMLTITDKEA